MIADSIYDDDITTDNMNAYLIHPSCSFQVFPLVMLQVYNLSWGNTYPTMCEYYIHMLWAYPQSNLSS